MPSSAVQGFEDPYNYVDQYNTLGQFGFGEGGFLQKTFDMLGLGASEQKERLKLADDRAYERASISSARAWEEYMDSTKYQRARADLEAAGLNPWLAVQNGLTGSGGASADTGGSAQHQTNSGQSKSMLAMLLLALAKILK